MSPGRKPRHGPNLQTVYDQIQGKPFLIRHIMCTDSKFRRHSLELLIKIKPKLSDIQSDAHVVKDLDHITSLAQSFSEQRPKSDKKSHLADALDQEGVNLWNASGLFRQCSDDSCRPIIAALRLAGFRLMEAGLEAQPTIEVCAPLYPPITALLHMLQIACKTGITLSAAGNNESAACVLACAAKVHYFFHCVPLGSHCCVQYEEALRNVDDPEGQHLHARARVTIVYFSSRMEAAWKENNEGLATFMADKITENDRQLALLSTRDREVLVAKFLDIGKSILRACTQSGKPLAEGDKAHDALRWLKKAFQVIEPLDCSATPELLELKRSVLRSLARGYFLASSQDPENLVRAEAALQEVIGTMDTAVEPASSEQQQLRWMKLAVVKRRKAGDTVVLRTLESIIENMSFSEKDLTDILQELRTLSHHNLVTDATRTCLRKAIACSTSIPSIEKLLIFLLFHCSKSDDHPKALKDLEESFQGNYLFPIISRANRLLSKPGASVCLTLIWQYGDRHYHASRWAEAADWFMSGTHAIFSGLGASSLSKCFRKAAVCQLQQKEYARAMATIRRCPQNGATTRYVAFLVAVRQATKAVKEMVEAPDFDRRMLLLACRLSHDSDMKGLLLSVLRHLLDTLNFRENVDTVTESMTLIRCIIRLTLKLLAEPGANSVTHENATMVIRDLSWLWRTAYNCAIEGCSVWENQGEQVSEAFDAARELLELYISRTLTEVEPSVHLYIANASFAATSGRATKVILARERISQDNVPNGISAETLLTEIKGCRARVFDLLPKVPADSQPQLHSFLHVLRVFAVEIASRLEDWGYVLATIKVGHIAAEYGMEPYPQAQEATRTDDQTLITFEAFCDILGILHACLRNSHLSLEKFSRWLRSICTILLSQGTVADRSKAMQYMEQASAVLEEHGNLVENGHPLYPVDERLWLLSTAYNTGVECLHASLGDEAKRWFECSTVLCRFVPDGRLRADKISKAYTELLTRYTGQRARSPM
ncbi:meiosis protein SPO22/ZIP4 like-domain-containing protein [Boletus coccyginus]|nr:meiosis protein SPO22/ZIP4 like-domain-containing protein [Boletus coccyginus]